MNKTSVGQEQVNGISVVINTYNASCHLQQVLDTVKGFDEVVVCDMESTDDTLDKVRELRELITNTGSQALIEVDGGVNLETGRQLVEAGADVLVAGNAVFKAPDMSDMIHRLKSL